MDRQNREGGKTGSGHGLLTAADQNAHRRSRLLSLALSTASALGTDPYLLRNHLGQFECVLCLTIHTSEASYFSHTQAKKHQANLSRRAAREAAKNNQALPAISQPASTPLSPAVGSVKCGRPQFTCSKVRCPVTKYPGILLHVHFPNSIVDPQHRFMSAFEQRLEAPNRSYQYLLVAAEPYETVAFKVPNKPLYEDCMFSYWDNDFKVLTLQVLFKIDV